jgi:hypothetical protein
MPRRRPGFGSGEAGAERPGVPEDASSLGWVVADKLKKFIDAGGSQKQWLPDVARGPRRTFRSLG